MKIIKAMQLPRRRSEKKDMELVEMIVPKIHRGCSDEDIDGEILDRMWKIVVHPNNITP